ncbi:lytic transglycosylase domain-containing protein [Micromonospora sp. NPDC092111]|uniref:aggregation-promoting factor C-terminal-like domain-containing protein n=1 Tax=Micromonospora sp. NPDC092111 TaxID=3364289 RepID=UPI003811DA66
MSRLWSRFGARTAAVALLSVGVAGGFYLGEDRETQQQGLTAQVGLQVDQAEYDYQRELQADHRRASAKQRAAEYQAKLRAAAAAKEAAERAKEAEAAAASRKKAREAEKEAEAAASKPFAGPIPASCNEYGGNRKIGCALLLQEGFKIDQMPCLDKLWTKESGWNAKASNSSSGAYGIPQAVPGSKMGSVADDWRTNPATQIKWGLGYIEGRYDNPCGAWAKSQSSGWY